MEPLLKKALNIPDLTVREELINDCQDVLVFYMFDPVLSSDAEHLAAYNILVSALCETAKRVKRVYVDECLIVSEKEAFRQFLYRLGLKGDEYRGVRKVLMQNLEGAARKNLAYKRKKAAKEVATV